jgi:hypothetical protein
MTARLAKPEDLELACKRFELHGVHVTPKELTQDKAVITIDDAKDSTDVFWASLHDNKADGSPWWAVHYGFEKSGTWGPLVLVACKEAVRLGLGDIPARWLAKDEGNPTAGWYRAALNLAPVAASAREDGKAPWEITPAQVVKLLARVAR